MTEPVFEEMSAAEPNARSVAKTWWNLLYDWAEAIAIAVLAVVFIFAFLFRVVTVDGQSMNRTLKHGEQLILSRFSYTPSHGDIVVLQMEQEQRLLIKRVIGVAGDTIEVTKDGQVLRNGEVLEEPYISDKTAQEGMTDPVVVPEGHVFVMGDNRASGWSWDSRSFGCIKYNEVVGKVVFRISPLNRMGGLYDKY